MKQNTFVAFLRGINVGGNAVIKMALLKKWFESLGFTNVMPVLASGNILFQSSREKPAVLKRKIEQLLAQELETPVVAIVRSASQILKLVGSNPFKNTKITPQTRRHVTFLGTGTNRNVTFPTRLPVKEFQIVQVSPDEVCSIVDASAKAGTGELMKILENEFGKNITTRTWNTVEKIAGLLTHSS